MKIKNYTTIEKSKKLLELGLDHESADMVYVDGDYLAIIDGTLEANDIPCWSVGALLDLLPEYIGVDGDMQMIYCYPQIHKQCFQYKGYDCIHDNSIILCEFRYSSYIENCFEMICWLLENGYIKKG